MFMSLKTSNKYQLKKGDLVTLSEMWQNIGGERIRSQWSQPIVGIITEIVISAGMPAGKHMPMSCGTTINIENTTLVTLKK